MTGRSDKVETTMDSSVDDVSVSHRCELFTQVGGMLIFDVFDDGFPAGEIRFSQLAPARRDDQVKVRRKDEPVLIVD